jgi:hypothetical protein
MCARTMEAEADREGAVRAYDPGAISRSWTTKSANSGPGPAMYDLAPLPRPPVLGRNDKKNSWFGVRAVQDVSVNLKVPGVSYDTRV